MDAPDSKERNMFFTPRCAKNGTGKTLAGPCQGHPAGCLHRSLPILFQGQKELGKDDFTKIPMAAPVSSTALSLIFTGGVHGKRFSPNRFVEIVSTAPAKLFGLYPRKGTIAVGSDADLVIFNPIRKRPSSAKTHHMRVDYSMFEGIRIKGVPRTVLSRGRTVIDAGKSLSARLGPIPPPPSLCRPLDLSDRG